MTRLLLALVLCACSMFAQQMSLKTWTALSATGTTAAFATAGNDKHTVSLAITGTPGGCSAQLEGSLDNANWFSISGSQTCTSNVMFHVVDRAVVFVRVNVTALSGGSSPTVTPTYLGIRSGGRQ